jgi:hypothetical protein
MSQYHYDYDYDSLASDCEELYLEHEEDTDSSESGVKEWENYYHNIAEELIDE